MCDCGKNLFKSVMIFLSNENPCLFNEPSRNSANLIKRSSNKNVNLNLSLGHSYFSNNPELMFSAKNKVGRSNSAVEITNCKNNSNHATFSYSNEVVSNESFMASTKSKVPDILMINKYYGLIPQKFTISSRKAGSTPSSASSSSRRFVKSPSAKPRAKSSTYQHASRSKTERRHSEEKAFRSENESPEPIKMILIPRRGSGSGCESPVEKPSDPFGPVTKKMSVERYKRWKSCGGGKGRNVSIRSNSDIGKTLSQLDNRLPGGCLNSHAKNNNRVSTADYMTNRRVIKIDLKRVSSWDEENYRITTSSVEPTEGENKELKLKVANPAPTHNDDSDCTLENGNSLISSSNIGNSCYSSCSSYIFSRSNTGYSRSRSTSSSEDKSSSTFSTSRPDNNGSSTCLVNNNNDCDSPVSNGDRDNEEKEKTTLVSSVDTLVDINESTSLEIITTTSNNSTITSCVSSSVEMPMSDRKESSFEDGVEEKLLAGGVTGAAVDEQYDNNEGKEDKHIMNKSMIGSCENAMKICQDKKVASMQRFGKLSSRTISFDDKILDGSCNKTSEREESGSTNDCLAKRRPTTASARVNSKTFSTPNGFNPPSKVIPWTQQKTAGGKSMTLAERRAKFQRVPSVHSSSSMSMDCGDEEGFSEVETNNQNQHCTRPPTSAFRETRKPLHVTQPAEIPTMISQINPNADEDIQIEIEKVALMLKKMNSMKHFSMSLDSGIEAEMGKASSVTPEASPNLRKCPSASTESLGIFQDGNKGLKSCGSESSVSSTDNSDDEERESQMKSKLNTMSSALTSKAVSLCSNNGGSRAIKSREMTSGSDSLIKRQCSANSNSSASRQSPSVRSNNKKMNFPLSSTSSTAATSTPTKPATVPLASSIENCSSGTIRRHPFRKAMSISCEQELLMSGGEHKRNEVNSNANDNVKSLRPKTAAPNSQSQRNNVTGTRSTNGNSHYRQSSISVSGESHHASGAIASSASGSQGSRNRKILIKKALMEINQSSSPTMKKMWGTVGRPRTAPSSEKSNLTVHAQQQHPRKPLKASPFPISGNGKPGLGSSGKSVSTGGGKTSSKGIQGDKTPDKTSPTGQMQRSSSEAPEDTGDKSQGGQQQSESKGYNSNRRQSVFRQCFSLDENALLGFSIKSVNEGRIPIFEKLPSADSTESCSSSIMDDEISFLSSKKREQCLKVYEKMTKTGCTIKLETIFRGMLTPSEYRAFMKAAEKATQEAEEDEETSKQIEENIGAEDDDSLLEN